MPTDRPNSTLSAAVDQVLAEQLNSPVAARLLAEHGAGFALICRVLADPDRRRLTDQTGIMGGSHKL